MRTIVVLSAVLLSLLACNRTPDVRGRYVYRSQELGLNELRLLDSGVARWNNDTATERWILSENADSVLVTLTLPLSGRELLTPFVRRGDDLELNSLASPKPVRYVKQRDR